MIQIEGEEEYGADVVTTRRKNLTPSQRVRLFEVHGGICALCSRRIHAGESWVDEHLRALGLGGSNNTNNRAPVHEKCAKVKTHDIDMPAIVKAKAQKRAHLGVKESKWPALPGTKRSAWKRKLDGTLERRKP
jgi:5-methylcytosine-specific restriction endonuclease McrA